ncbi:MAG TPA: FAD-dependent oxidoreductase [Gammaproteobacteria bacterium]|nr:FAD-dependent oxidoreductase [Gammaproteobacteria bacterium]
MIINLSSPDPYIAFVEQQRINKKLLFSPWSTHDDNLLQITRQFFPDIPLIFADKLIKPNINPVEILPLDPSMTLKADPNLFIAVGGPPAATVALQVALNKRNVLYVCDANSHPIWAGAGNHGEPDGLTEAPAYTAGHSPFSFIFRELLRLLRPCPIENITTSSFSWLSLNISEWMKHPKEWLSGFQVAYGSHRLYKKFYRELKKNKVPGILQKMRERAQLSGQYLNELNKFLGGNLIRTPRGSLLIAYSTKEWANLLKKQALLNQEGLALKPLTKEEVQLKYGFLPRHGIGFLEKRHDFIFQPDFYQNLLNEIKKRGGKVITNQRLNKIWVDTNPPHLGIMEFVNIDDNSIQHQQFSNAHLSLGATLYKPNLYNLISVTGVSMNALLIGVALKGGAIVCGGTNHIVPLCQPEKILVRRPGSKEVTLEDVTLVRLSAAANVSPLNRGVDWYTYNGQHALHLLHQVKKTLPINTELRVLSAYGCNRVIGKDGHQVEIHPQVKAKGTNIACDNITIQIGAGGGGLTQMGYVPFQIQNPAKDRL